MIKIAGGIKVKINQKRNHCLKSSHLAAYSSPFFASLHKFNHCVLKPLTQVSKFFVFLSLVGLAIGCANPVTPTGGPKDVTPPRVIKSEPANYSLNFKKSVISITFDEFVKLKNPIQQVIISPPLDEFPEYKLRGKSVVIDLKGKLVANTTYTIFFGSAIVDLAEDNPLANYVYAFSTGDHIDSLSVGGEVLNAFDHKPQEGVFVMLYPQKNDTVPQDSVPCKVRPLYISKTDKNGIFQLRNLRNEPYKIFALKDVNSNYLFDQPNEEIAFIDSLISPEVVVLPKPDDKPADSAKKDSLIVSALYKNFYRLLMFQQTDTIQRILGDEMLVPGRYKMVFKYPVKGAAELEVINKEIPANWKVEEFNSRRDTLMVWLRDVKMDSLQVQVSVGDSILDTTMIVLRKQKTEKKKRKTNEAEIADRLKINSNAKSRSFELGTKLWLTFDDPLSSFNFSRALFITGDDTTSNPGFLPTDSIHRHFVFDGEFAEETNYEFLFTDSSFYSMYGPTNDSTILRFKTKAVKDYGNLLVEITLKEGKYPYIIQLLSLKEQVLRETYLSGNDVVSFKNITPGKYLIKAIGDKWPNRRWDSGDYFKNRQPENVLYFPAELEIRANWDVEKNWSLP